MSGKGLGKVSVGAGWKASKQSAEPPLQYRGSGELQETVVCVEGRCGVPDKNLFPGKVGALRGLGRGQRGKRGWVADPGFVSPQVNREIVSGMKYIQHTYRKGVKSE